MATTVSVLDSVEVARGDDGRLAVTWRVAGDCQSVDLAWGLSADGLDHGHLRTVDARSGRAELDAGPPERGRVYVSVAPAGQGGPTGPGATIAGERRIGLVGPVNFRDLGGYRGRDGRRVRWGRVFRADALVLDDRDTEAFGELGIRTVYDLRSDAERDTVPNRLPDARRPTVVALSLVSTTDGDSPIERLSYSDGESFLEQLYLHILDSSAANFGRVLSGLAGDDEIPAVFHCAAGKDRTGLVAAVLLSVLGVSEKDILDDYELTGRYRTTEHVQASVTRMGESTQLAPEVVAGILRAPRWAMQSALAQLRERYGSFDGYLTGPAGAATDVPDRLRERLLSPG